MSQATETLDQVRTQTGGFAGFVRPRFEVEAQVWQIITKLPEAEEDWEDTYRGQLTGLLFALGMGWDEARLVALSLWDKSHELPAPPPTPDPQCPACRSWNIDEDEEHEPPGAYYRCRQCGETWVEHSEADEEYIMAELLESLDGRAVVQPAD